MLTESQQGATRILSLNRPEAGNALSLELALALEDALLRCQDDQTVSAVIITGTGTKFFCTGGDVKRYSLITSPAALHEIFDRVAAVLDLIESHPLPVLAAVNGYAIGGGLELALACDMRFATSEASFGFPQVKLGIVPGWNGIERILNLVGRSTAMRLLLSGERVSAATALRLGLIDEVADQQPVLELALGFAAKLEQAAPLALRATKQAVNTTLNRSQSEARASTRELFRQLWFSADHKEAEVAFAEKRLPTFTGKL
jgi:enoyl-CoA hydratase